jgi:hypothetical protein
MIIKTLSQSKMNKNLQKFILNFYNNIIQDKDIDNDKRLSHFLYVYQQLNLGLPCDIYIIDNKIYDKGSLYILLGIETDIEWRFIQFHFGRIYVDNYKIYHREESLYDMKQLVLLIRNRSRL